MPGKIVSIGNALVDILASVDHDFIAQQGVTPGGMTLVDHARSRALYEAISDPIEAAGGSAANTVAIAASLGAPSAFIGKVADDNLGFAFLHGLTSLGVEVLTAPMTASDTVRTGNCLSLVTDDGQRTMCTHLGAAQALEALDLPLRPLEEARTVFFEGYLLDSPNGHAVFEMATALAEGKLAFTLSDAGCVARHREFLEMRLEDIDLLFGNAEELAALFGEGSAAETTARAGRVIPMVVCTDGPNGAHVAHKGQVSSFPARPTKVVDTTGAGDSFAGTVLWALHEGHSLEMAAQMALIVAAEVISQKGARPARCLRTLLEEAAV
jgi:sugar/nucleoside kinase (ribokinase family)